MSCFWEQCVEEQERIGQYAQIAIQVADEDGDDETFCQKIRQKKSPINGAQHFHPTLGPLFLSMFTNAEIKL